jgi:hypothetical protein
MGDVGNKMAMSEHSDEVAAVVDDRKRVVPIRSSQSLSGGSERQVRK